MQVHISAFLAGYHKPPTISPGLIFFHKRFLMGLCNGGLIYGGGYTWTSFCVSVIVINKNINSDKQVGLYSDGFIFGWAYIWNEVSVSTCGRLIDGDYIQGGAYIRRFMVIVYTAIDRWFGQIQ